MLRRLPMNLLVFAMVVFFSLFLNACTKDVVVEETQVETKEEVPKVEEKVSKEDEAAEQKRLEEERAAREAQLREEALREEREREEAARREEATRREAQLREEFQNVNIHFDFDKFVLTDEAREILAEKSSYLLENPAVKIEIEGHCDERGTTEYNIALGERRANSALKYLVNAGINSGRISTISYGEERPLYPESNETAWAKNRRDQFKIISE